MTKSRNFLRCGILATMTFLYGACNSDEVPQESNSNSASNTDTDSNSNTNTESDSNTPATPGSNSESESNSNSLPTAGTVSESESADTSASTPSQADASNTNTESDSDSSTESAGSDTEGDTESDSDTDTAGVCVAPPATDECETCLYDNCKDEYCACAGDQKCLCVMDCLDGITGGNDNSLDDLLGLDLDGLLGGLLDDLLGDLFDDLTNQDFEDLTEILECLTNDPCGVPLDLELEDLLDGTDLDPGDLLDLDDLLELDDLDDILENILEVAGNSLSPLLTCAELTNPDGECGTLCPLEESVLND